MGPSGLGGANPLTVSFFPHPQNPDGVNSSVGASITHGIDGWNSQLRNPPADLAFDVFDRIPDGSVAADIFVVINPNNNACPNDPACSGAIGDTGPATITITSGVFDNQPAYHQLAIGGHELGHVFAMLNHHYVAPLDCVSIMSNCTATYDQATTHDNEDVYNVLRQNGVYMGHDLPGTAPIVPTNFIERFIESSFVRYRMRWNIGAIDAERSHAESNFQIWRDSEVNFVQNPDPTLYAEASRNSDFQDGLDHFGLTSGQAFITVSAGQHWCFRARTENLVFSGFTIDRFGKLSSSDCITRTQDNLVARTDKLDAVNVRLNNEGFFTKNNVQVFIYNGPNVCPAIPSLAAGGSVTCSFASTDTKGALLIFYNGVFQASVGFDSFKHN